MASSSNLSAKPGVQKIVANVKDCVDELKKDFNENHRPITDDSQDLQRFCVNIEFLLRHEQIEKSSFLGGKKDYWNYFIEGLNSVKGVSDGLKFVKSRTELTTNTGRGRAFLRFCLMYQRLADCLQLCTSNAKLTSQWYKSGSVWRDPSQSGYLVSMLYDLNDVTFDLGAHGYDLDNGWPTFSRSEGSGQRWNLTSLSRSSSISSFSQSMFTPNSSFMSSSYTEPEVQKISEQREGESHSDFADGLRSNRLDSVSHGAADELINGSFDSVAVLEGERDNLREEVDDVRSQLSASDARSSELERRLAEVETRNKELVASLSQLVQDQSAASSAQAGQLSKYQELVDKYTQLEALKSEKERECDQLLSTQSVLEERLAASKKESAERQTTIDRVSQDKSHLEETLSTIANSLMEKSSLVEEMTSSHASKLADIQTCHASELTQLQTSHTSQLNELQTTHNSLVSDYDTLQKAHEALQDSHLSLETQLRSLSIDHEALRASHQQLELTQTGASDYTESLKAQLATAHNHHKESEELVLQLKSEVKSGNERQTSLTQRCEKLESLTSGLNSDLVDQKNETLRWKNEVTSANNKIAEFSSTLSIKEEQLRTALVLQEESTTMVNQLRSQLTDQQEQHSFLLQENNILNETISRLESESSRQQGSIAALELSQNQLQTDINLSKKDYSSAQEKLTSQEALLSESKEQHALRLAESHAAQEELLKKLEASASEVSALRLAVDKMEEERKAVDAMCNRQRTEIGELEQQLVHIHTAHESLQTEQAHLQTESSSLTKELASLVAKNRGLELEREKIGKERLDLAESLESMHQRVAKEESEQEQSNIELLRECEKLGSDNQALQASLSAAGEELELVKAARDALRTKVEEEQKAKLELSSSLTQVTGETETLKSLLKSLKAEALEKGSELSELQTRFDSTKLDLLNKQSIMEQQIGALRFQIGSQQMEADLATEGYKTQQEEVNKMAQTITTQERQIASIQLQLDTLVDERSLETDIHTRQVDELVLLLDEKEAELLSLVTEMATYKDDWGTLNESNTTLQKSLVELKLGQGTQLAKAENELHQLREDNTMLKKRLIKLIKDKETLWQTTDELMSKQQQRTVNWVSSSDVTNCMACNSTFTLLLRKHHCRVCGKVFCWQCSNNWTLTSSGRKERCCNQCFIVNSEPVPSESLNSSTITSDNSVDSVTIPTLPARRFSVTEDISSPNDTSRCTTPDSSIVIRPLEVDSPDGSVSSPINSAADENVVVSGDVKKQSELTQEVVSNSPSAQEPVLEDSLAALQDEQSTALACDRTDEERAGGEPSTSGQMESEERIDNQIAHNFHTENGVSEREHLEESENRVEYVAEPENEGLSPASLSDSLRDEYTVVIDSEMRQLTDPVDAGIEALSHYTVCVVVDKEDTTLAWTLTSESKPVHFQLDFKPSMTGFSQGNEVLIPECKCRSHKREFKGEMISHNSGLYIFTFINKSESELRLRYLITLA